MYVGEDAYVFTMGRNKHLVAPAIAAALVAAASLCLNAQAASQSGPIRRVTLPASGTTRLSGTFWRGVLSNGRPMPRVERLLVIDRDGVVLAEADGETDHVMLPEGAFRLLSSVDVQATLVHNHTDVVSLSGTDLGQLGKPGVARVIAVGPDGSVFEATAGTRFDHETFEALYLKVLTDLKGRVNREARREGVDLGPIYPNLSHLVALALDRAGVIRYRMTPSLKLRVELDRYRHVLEWTVGSSYDIDDR
jgi:hypothetical protein